MPSPNVDQLLSIKSVCKILDRSRASIYRDIRKGRVSERDEDRRIGPMDRGAGAGLLILPRSGGRGQAAIRSMSAGER